MSVVSHGSVEGENALFQTTQLFLVIFRMILAVGGIALITNLYKKAMVFEKGHCGPDPEKAAFYNQVSEIQEKVEEIFKKSSNAAQSSDKAFKSQNLVAWLLNRSKEAQSNERQLFFQRLNQELAEEHLFYFGGRSNLENAEPEDRLDNAGLLSPANITDHNDIYLEHEDGKQGGDSAFPAGLDRRAHNGNGRLSAESKLRGTGRGDGESAATA